MWVELSSSFILIVKLLDYIELKLSYVIFNDKGDYGWNYMRRDITITYSKSYN